MGSMTGRVALVTGASRGCGKGIALVLGEQGATVYGFTDIDGSQQSPFWDRHWSG